MTIVAGIDEAGYGPYLGPLVVSASAVRVPPELADANLWEVLASGVAPVRAEADGRLVIADSKQLYSNHRGLDALEEGTLAALAAAGQGAGSLWSLLECLGAGHAEEYQPYPWYHPIAVPLPAATQADRIESRAQRLQRALARVKAEMVCLRSIPVLEGRFNRLLAETDNKSEVCFTAVGLLLRHLRDSFPGEILHVTVDKQGGRNRYVRALRQYFPDADIEVVNESERLSQYILRERVGKMDLRFQPEADGEVLPVALASMVSKYVRELFMGLLNRYWQAAVPGLVPTSGYPNDAGRFLAALQDAGALTGLDCDLLIRRR